MTTYDERFPAWLRVSRETIELLRQHLDLVSKWSKTVNLVSGASLDAGWKRHVLDSAQVWFSAEVGTGRWVDLGSGGGFPGLVVAILAKERAPNVAVTLVESDRRKAAFLHEAGRTLGLSVEVKAARLESMVETGFSAVSARALAPLTELIAASSRLLGPSGVAVFPKGALFEKEIERAQQVWSFDCESIPSKTVPGSAVLRISSIRPLVQ